MVVGASSALIALSSSKEGISTYAEKDYYWNHYARVEPTETKHGSREFWANCSTHEFVLSHPGAEEDIREGVAFDTTSYFATLDKDDDRYIPSLNDRVDIKGYLETLLSSLDYDPYDMIPATMTPKNTLNYVSGSDVNYDFTNFTNVSDIKYGGFGEQWNMVITNIEQSQYFYNVVTIGSDILAASRAVVSLFLEDYYKDTVNKTFSSDSRYISKIAFDGYVLTYNVCFLSSIDIPLFGSLTPQIDMSYALEGAVKTVRIGLNDNNALKFVVTPTTYTFALEYGIETVSRKAYLSIDSHVEEMTTGHIYEFVQYKDKDLVNSCADFYIDETYTSVVGNKASGMLVTNNYITELYKTGQGKLLGYEIKETKSKVTYNTLWFNLNNITNINNVKAIEKESPGDKNPHDIYLNGSDNVFEPKYNTKLGVKTSRRYDVELRKQYFYGVEDEELVKYETIIPMMFIQAGDNFNTFENDISTTNGINASVTLASEYIEKIEEDYATLIDTFIEHKGDITGEMIEDYIGEPAIIVNN